MKKTIQQHSERTNKHKVEEEAAPGAIPAYLLDREQTSRAKVLSNTIKQKRKDKAGKWRCLCRKCGRWRRMRCSG